MLNSATAFPEIARPTPSLDTTTTALLPPSPLSDPLAASLSLMGSSTEVKEIAFVDAGLSDYQTLVDGFSPDTAVYVLNPAGDELSQITQVLAGYSNLSSVSIFSHGSDGALQLGSTSLNMSNLVDYAGLVQSWASSFSETGDLLLYGCDVAEDEIGQNFVRQLAALTGADVAASTDLTGSGALGGNWNLEFSTGSIEASASLSDWAQAAYQNVLAMFTVTNTNDSGAGSLRQAILDANAAAGADTIIFGSDFTDPTPDTITLTSGQLTITDSLIITGTGANRLTISGNKASRIFQVNSGVTATLDGLTLTGGSTTSDYGGGIYNQGTLTLSNSTLSGNSASFEGGGIKNDRDATLTVSNSTISGNKAGSDGGGIYNQGTLTLSNSTLSGNSAVFTGGGINNNRDAILTVINSTLSGNKADAGGGINNYDATFTVINSTLSGNKADAGGGGIDTDSNKTVTVSNSTISGNTGGNSGGITLVSGSLNLTNSLVTGNNASDGEIVREVYVNTGAGASFTPSNGYNLFGYSGISGVGVKKTTPLTPLPGITPNVALDKILNPLGNNGGPTQTHALVADSPAINAGDPNFTSPPNTDQRGFGRVAGGRIDIGAFEFGAVPPPNRPPVATNDSFTIAEDNTLTVAAAGGVLANDTDADGNSLTAILVAGPNNGTLTLNSSGSFVYTPTANFNGTDSFTYRANDGTVNSNIATVTINVTPVNDASVATNDSFTVAEDNTLTIPATGGVLANDTDADGNLLTASLVTGPSNGSLTLNANGSFVYTPTANFNGTDSFTYRANDGTINSNIATVTINVTPVNDAPTLSVTSLNPTFTEASGLGTQASAVNVFSNANGSTVESGQTFLGLTFTVAGLLDGAKEQIVVDGTPIALGVASSGTTTTNGLTYSVTLASGTATIALTSTAGVSAAALDTLINDITYQNTNTDNPTAGTRTFTLTQIKDNGGTANGGADVTSATLASTVNVVAVNDAPVVNLTQTSQAVTATSSPIRGIQVADVDAGSSPVQVTLSVTSGQLALLTNVTDGLTSAGINGNGSSTVTLTGTLAQINNTLAATNGLSYSNSANFNGKTNLTVTVKDNGNTGSGGNLTDSKTLTLQVAQKVNLGNPAVTLKGTVSSADPVDYYQFTLNGPTNKFRATLAGLKANADITIYQLNANGTLTQVVSPQKTGTQEEVISNQQLSASTYLIEVKWVDGAASTPYNLSFNA